jgi:hypothetical protein
MMMAPSSQPNPMSLWARRLAIFGVQLVLTAILLHRFSSFPTPAMLGAFKAAMAIGLAAIVLALVALRIVWRKGGKGVGASLVGGLFGLTLLGWPVAILPVTFRTPAIPDISTDTQTPPQFRDIAKLREPAANPLAYQAATLASLQTQAYPDIRTMVVTRPGQESFDLTREIIRRMKWVEVAARPPGNATATAEIEARSMTPILGFRDDVIIRLKGERDKTRIDIRSASPYGQHDLGRNAARVRALMQELHIRLDLGVPLEPEVVAKRRSIRKRLLQQQARGQVTAGQPGTPAGQSPPSAGRARTQTPEQRSQGENPAPGKRRRQSWE